MDNRKNIRAVDDLSGIDLNFWEKRICPICKTEFYVRKKYKKITCSDDCYRQYIEVNKNDINEKRRLKSYQSYHSKTKEEITAEHEKAKETCLARYGYSCKQKTPGYRKMMSKRFKNKDWSFRNDKIKEGLMPKYKSICDADNLELITFRNRFDCTVKCKKCGNIFEVHVLGYLTDKTNYNLCRKCHPNINSTSETKPLKFIEDILNENGITYIKNNRTVINPFEIDILVEELHIGFEINGNYWHSEYSCGKGKDYHLNKTKLCAEKGIKLIQIFEDEIVNKPEIVKSRIKNILGLTENIIYARNCEIRKIDYIIKKDFLEENHIDGDSVSKYNYGLFYKDDLVSVCTFGNRKISKKDNFEVIRFANKINTSVIGGFSKFLSHFINDVQPKELITYADIRWSGIDYKNAVYNKNGFVFDGYTKPNYFYEDKKNYLIRINRLNFTKQKLLKNGYDANKTEKEIMFENGYDRIWDCGSMKFRYCFND